MGHHAELLAQPMTPNPVLGRRGVAADGDLIVSRMLVEVKTSASPLRRADLWQLAGYVLLDRADAFDDVAFYVARWGQLVRWSASDYLEALAGSRIDLDELRAGFDDAALRANRRAVNRPS
jgi:hypothetical protein